MKPAALLLAACLLFSACGDPPRVVAYVALDREFSQPILDAFEHETGIRVDPVFDVEAAKTIQLVGKIVAERDRPQCDVFWNNEIVQTIRLADMGRLEPYPSPNARDIPAEFKDEAGLWAGFAARARVVIYNKGMIAEKDVPLALEDWGKPEFKGRAAVANPRFGTTSTQMAALLTIWGEERLSKLWTEWGANGVAILAGNAAVKNDVAAGTYSFGLTDTDDAFLAIGEGAPVGLLYPKEGLLVPNSIAMIKGAPHADNAKAFIDYILRPETEALLAAGKSGQIPLRAGVSRPETAPAPEAVNSIVADWIAAARGASNSAALMDRLIGQTSLP